MCGIFGFIDLVRDEVATADLYRGREALHAVAHRGPDGWSDFVHGRVYMGHRRLSIIDLSDAALQPFVTGEAPALTAVTVNGEIYNHAELRACLADAPFKSRSDSEVALHGFRAWGLCALADRLDGMYAIAIHDRASESVVLVRDRAGIKPLYFGRVGDYLVWASELKAIQRFCGDALTLDEEALFDFLTYRYIPAPKSMFREIRKLEAASYAQISTRTGAVRSDRYWNVDATLEDPWPGDAESSERLRDLLRRSVHEHLLSDVPVGFFLSGGVDSSAVLALAAEVEPRPRTFSIGFDVPEHDESPWAELVANAHATRHRSQRVSRESAAGLLDQMRSWFDEPFADTSALPTWHLCALARTEVKVALSGDGADELFGGYRWYRRMQRYRRANRAWSRFGRTPTLPYRRPPRHVIDKLVNRLVLLAQSDVLELYSGLLSNLTPWEKREARDALSIPRDYDDMWAFRRFWRPELGVYRALQYLDFHTFLPDDILTKVDRTSMAVSLEVRVPFLSKQLVEFAFSLPQAFLYRGGQLKGGLKYALRGVVPDQVLRKPKQGFSIPTDRWNTNTSRGARTFQLRYLDDLMAAHAGAMRS